MALRDQLLKRRLSEAPTTEEEVEVDVVWVGLGCPPVEGSTVGEHLTEVAVRSTAHKGQRLNAWGQGLSDARVDGHPFGEDLHAKEASERCTS